MTKTTTAKAAPAKTETSAPKVEVPKAKAPEPVEETCLVCGAVTTNAAHGVCLACRS